MTAIEDSDIFEVSTPELHDVVRLEDRYGREDKQEREIGHGQFAISERNIVVGERLGRLGPAGACART